MIVNTFVFKGPLKYLGWRCLHLYYVGNVASKKLNFFCPSRSIRLNFPMAGHES